MANRVHVEQALGGVRVPAVARIDDRDAGLHMLRNQVRGTCLGVPDDKHVGVHRGKVIDRVEQRFALGR